MATIIESQAFDICVTESPDYKGVPRYIVRYGLDVKKRESLLEAIDAFKACLDHALQCEGYLDDGEEF